MPGTIINEYYQIYGRVNYQLDNNERAIELFDRYLSLIEEDEITALPRIIKYFRKKIAEIQGI